MSEVPAKVESQQFDDFTPDNFSDLPEPNKTIQRHKLEGDQFIIETRQLAVKQEKAPVTELLKGYKNQRNALLDKVADIDEKVAELEALLEANIKS